MNRKPVAPREQAHRDVDDAVTYYLREAGPDIALDFIDALEKSYGAIAENPEIGSPRYAQELGLPNMRHWPIDRFPYLVFYVDGGDLIDVWRVLNGRRDIPASLQEAE